MDTAALDALLAEPESDRVERKESFASDKVKERVYEAICAFANDYADHREPGVVIIGQRDDRSSSGLAIDDALIATLAQIKNTGRIVPVPSMSVFRRTIGGHEVAAVVVEPSSAPPVRFDGRTWIRTGSTRSIATYEQEQRLSERRRHSALPFDARPLPYVPVDEIDGEYFRSTYLPGAVAREVIAANHRDLRGQMVGLRMLDPSGEPTALGVLLLAIDPQRWIAGSYVQFLRFDGTAPEAPIVDAKEITGRIAEVIRRTEEILDSHVRVPTRFADVALEQRTPDYPIAALRQLLRNAVMHRAYDGTNAPVRVNWFDDRIEIQNPGGPYGQVTRANFGSGATDYRNPNLAGALKDLGFVQRFGQGLAIARNELERNGSPPLEWELGPTATLMRVRRRS